MRWGIDISRYDDLSDAQWQAMVNNGLSFAIIRACHGAGYTDPFLQRHVAQANKYGIPFGLYQWVDITQDVQKQIDHFLQLIEQYPPKCATGDFEQYWTDWDAWNQARLGGGGDVPTMPPAHINAINYEYFTKMRSALSIPLVSYTGAWFVNKYCPQMSAWLGQSYLWLAGYISAPAGVIGWDNFLGIVSNLGSPVFPVGLNRWDVWQFSASLPITGLPQLDLDAIASEEVYNNLFILSKPYELPSGGTTGQARVIAQAGLRVRAAPNLQAQILRTLPYGTLVDIVEIQNGWAHLVDGGWCAAQWLQLIDDTPEPTPPDTTAPAAIVDLAAATGTATGSIDLAWTAPGDDANVGTASNYQVRYSTSAIESQAAWDAATPVTVGVSVPKSAGQAEQMTVSGLTPGTAYYFAIRALDEAANLGGLSNSPSAIAKQSPIALPCVARVTAGAGLRVRTAASLTAQILRTLPYNTQVVVVEIIKRWGRLADGGWCAIQWLQLLSDVPVPQQDLIAPAAIMDLAAAPGTAAGSIDLSWAAPGDDAHIGTAASYLVRYSVSVIDSPASWEAATPVTNGVPQPKPAGQSEQMTVSGLTPGALYYFAVRAQDEVPNLGGLSNSPSAIAKAPPPSQPRMARVTAGAGLRVRTAPDLKAQILRTMPYGTQVEVAEIKDDWARLSAGGWSSAQWLELLPETPEPPAEPPSPPTGVKRARVTVKIGLRVRVAPNLQAEILRALPYDTIVEFVEIKDGWAHLTDGGWCAAQWLEVIE
jgi:GH25 family lysozyme M1 (1,4-beta-N-acetylmuramidase)